MGREHSIFGEQLICEETPRSSVERVTDLEETQDGMLDFLRYDDGRGRPDVLIIRRHVHIVACVFGHIGWQTLF